MARIGTLNFITLRGGPPTPIGTMLVEITRQGRDGYAGVDVGKRGESVELTSLTDVHAADVTTYLTAALALQGTLVTLVSDCGITQNNVLVERVRRQEERKVVTPIGGLTAGEYLVTLRWTLRATE